MSKPETRPERLLPSASCALTKLERGVCPICGVRVPECITRRRASGERLDQLLSFFGLAPHLDCTETEAA